MAGKATPAIRALQRAKVTHTVHDLGEEGIPDDDRGYGMAAAAVMDMAPERIFKTILVSHGRQLAVVVVPVTATVDLKAAAKVLGVKKVAVADKAEAERVTGYVIGGISPLGQRKHLPTIIDASALDHPTINVSAGRRGLEVELTGQALVTATKASVADVARHDDG